MRKKMFLLFALFTAVIFFSLESLSYAGPSNPPGPRGGPGAGPRRGGNPPGPAGGPGAGHHRGGNPPGPVGGPGAGQAMVNPPGPVGGPGAGPRRDIDNNPPGPAGGPGTNWENLPGPAGGPGAGPDNRPMINPPGPVGGPGAGPTMGNPPANESAAVIPANMLERAAVDKPWEKAADLNGDGVVDKVEIEQWRRRHPRRVPQQ